MQRPFWGLNCKGLGVNNVSTDATCTEEQAESKRRYLPTKPRDNPMIMMCL